ncbi:MAG: malate/lactate/ureidoglycolate dehydrogenase [Methylobacteriaceae bacterium]|nr:malate/lactate/ureidoglycolate dehydrogenase [Methylobacteriaceae bacterium]
MVIIRAQALQGLVEAVFGRLGCSGAEGRQVAASLVGANLTGHDSHGVIRVPRYVIWLEEGSILANQRIESIIDTPALALLDGKFGLGQSVAPQAVEVGIAKCRESGIAAVALRNAGHVGRVGEWAEMAAEAGIVSIHFVNASGSVLVAPFGGIERRFSTAPYCLGVPRPGEPPIILDFATSLVAEGKCLVASQGGKPLPADALIGPDGRVGNDPRLIYGDAPTTGARSAQAGPGAIRAFGEHKGSGLALMCELLGGSLTGTGATGPERRFANGMFSIYIDPARVDPDGFFPADVARYIAYVKSAKPSIDGGEVLVPGEPERRTRGERLAKGIPLAPDTWRAIADVARRLGVEEERIAAAA